MYGSGSLLALEYRARHRVRGSGLSLGRKSVGVLVAMGIAMVVGVLVAANVLITVGALARCSGSPRLCATVEARVRQRQG